MTNETRGARPSSSSADMAHTPRPTDSLRSAWARVLDNSVLTDSQENGLDSALRLRMASFEYLVQRYMLQIRYGCENPGCTTPTCFSCVQRATNKPIRRPTPLTARALAYYLASQDDPTTGLCDMSAMASDMIVDALNIDDSKIDPRSLSQNLFSTRITRTLKATRALDEEGKPNGGLGNGSYDKKTKEMEGDGEIRRSGAAPAPDGQVDKLVIDTVSEGSGDIPSSMRAAAQKNSKAINGDANGHAVLPNGASQEQPRADASSPITQSSSGESVSRASSPKPNGTTMHNQDPPQRPATETMNGSVRTSKDNRKSTPSTKSPGQKLRIPVKPGSFSSPQFKSGSIIFATTHLTCAIMEDLKRIAMSDGSVPDTRTRDAIVEPAGPILKLGSKNGRWRLVDECLFRCLSSPSILIKSFREKTTSWTRRNTPLAHLDAWEMEHAFRSWQPINGSLIYDSLWYSLECLFTPPPELKIRKGSKSKRATRDDFPGRHTADDQTEYVSDEDAAHIIVVCIHALTSLVTRGKPNAWKFVRGLRPFGWGSPNDTQNLADNQTTVPYTPMWLMITDQLEYEPALRLATRLVRAIGARRCFSEMLRNTSKEHSKGSSDWVMTIVYKHLIDCERYRRAGLTRAGWDEERVMDTWSNWAIAGIFVEWLKTIVMKNWTGQHELKRWDAAGAAAEILGDLCKMSPEPKVLVKLTDSADYSNLNLHRHIFELTYFKYKLDTNELINSYMDRKEDPNYRHILQYPFFFPSSLLVQYFRALNFSSMSKHFTTAGNNFHLQDRFSRHFLSDYWRDHLDQHYSIASSRYLSLDVRRSHVLEDTLDQLWGLEKRQLLLPLKVRMGKLEGEQGVDQGGVAQEFFRVALAEAFNPDNGMFTVDPQTRMTWFQPFSMEPLARFELIGLLFSIAVYNGITLPVTFPGALYLKLLGKTVRPHHISDGWPDLVKSFQYLLKCEDEVGDILSRGYEFSFEARGVIININMNAMDEDAELPSPSTLLDYAEGVGAISMRSNPTPLVDWPPDSEAPLVTNANREQFVRDYASWLIDKSIRPQFEAFARGFRTCLPPQHLALLRPSLLSHMVEGSTHIDTQALERAARYDGGFDADHAFVRTFWEVVHALPQEQKRKLLEFVTASDRVPVAGIESVVFWVQRNGPDGEGLPTSSTCFGRLLLPEYASKEKLERKLAIALDNARGFGAA